MKNRQRMQALFDAVVHNGETVTLIMDGTPKVISKEQVWNAFVAACQGETNTQEIRQLMAAAGSNSRVVGLVRMLVKSIRQAQEECADLGKPEQNRVFMDDSGKG